MNTGKRTPKQKINPVVKAKFVAAPKQTIQAHALSFLCDGSPSQQHLQTTLRDIVSRRWTLHNCLICYKLARLCNHQTSSGLDNKLA